MKLGCYRGGGRSVRNFRGELDQNIMYKILLEFTKIIFLFLIAKYFIDSLGISCYVPQSHSPPKPSISSPHPCSILSKKNPLPKINSKPIKTKTHLIFCLPNLFISPSGIGCCSVSCSIPFCPITPKSKMSIAICH